MLRSMISIIILLLFFMFQLSSCSINMMEPLLPDDNTTEENNNTGDDEEETTEPEEPPLTCAELPGYYDEAMLVPDCDTASYYLDEIIAQGCYDGSPMDLMMKIMSFMGLGCTATCEQRAALAYIHMGMGNMMSALEQINIIAAMGTCVEICTELTTYYKDHGGAPAPMPCS